MVDGQVEFLNLESSLGWDADAEVAEWGELSSTLTGETEHLESLRPRDLGGGADVPCVAGGGEANEDAAGASEGDDELGEFEHRVNVVGDGGAERGKAGERDAGHRLLEFVGELRAETGALFLLERAERLETFHQLARPVIRIGGAASVAGDESIAAAAEAFEKHVGGLADVGGQRGEFRAAVEQFGEVVAAG